MNRREFLTLAAVTPFAVRQTPALASRDPIALVTCDTEARVAMIDLAAGRVVRSIRVEPGPRSIERVGNGLALVCHTVTGVVTIIDGRTGRIHHVLRDFVEPRYTARHPDGVHAFVSDSGREIVATVDIVRGQVLGHARLHGWARHLSLSPDALTLWVGLGTLAQHVSVVDVTEPAHPHLVRNLTPPFLAHDVGFFPDGKRVWVTAGQAATTAIYGADGREQIRLGADAGPQHVTFGRDVAYVTSGAAGTLSVHALDDGRVLRETPVPVGSYNVQAGPAGLVITPSLDHGTLSVLEQGGRLLHVVPVSTSSHDACFVI